MMWDHSGRAATAHARLQLRGSAGIAPASLPSLNRQQRLNGTRKSKIEKDQGQKGLAKKL